MTQYVKVTLKEFLDMREAIESNASQLGSWDEYQMSEARKAINAARAVENRNKIKPPPHVQYDGRSLVRQLPRCKCGAAPKDIQKVKGIADGFVIQCSNPACPATVQRVGRENCFDAWSQMATKLTCVETGS